MRNNWSLWTQRCAPNTTLTWNSTSAINGIQQKTPALLRGNPVCSHNITGTSPFFCKRHPASQLLLYVFTFQNILSNSGESVWKFLIIRASCSTRLTCGTDWDISSLKLKWGTKSLRQQTKLKRKNCFISHFIGNFPHVWKLPNSFLVLFCKKCLFFYKAEGFLYEE